MVMVTPAAREPRLPIADTLGPRVATSAQVVGSEPVPDPVVTSKLLDMKGGRVTALKKVAAREVACLAAEKVINAVFTDPVAVKEAVPRAAIAVAPSTGVGVPRRPVRQLGDRHQVPVVVATLLQWILIPAGASGWIAVAGDTPPP